MNDDSAFLRALREKPDDEVTRLVYADWLEEKRDPAGRAGGAFLRVEHELSRRSGAAPSPGGSFQALE